MTSTPWTSNNKRSPMQTKLTSTESGSTHNSSKGKNHHLFYKDKQHLNFYVIIIMYWSSFNLMCWKWCRISLNKTMKGCLERITGIQRCLWWEYRDAFDGLHSSLCAYLIAPGLTPCESSMTWYKQISSTVNEKQILQLSSHWNL